MPFDGSIWLFLETLHSYQSAADIFHFMLNILNVNIFPVHLNNFEITEH